MMVLKKPIFLLPYCQVEDEMGEAVYRSDSH